MDCIVEIKSYIEKNFSEKRKAHTEGVCKAAVKLAEIYGVDTRKAEIAALFHDMYRGVSENSLNYYVKHLGLDKKYINNASLAHGKIAAIIMERDFGVTDSDIINAVSYHTTGRAGMSTLEKVIYLADAIEEGRSYPGVEELRQVAFQNLDKACYMSMVNTENFVKSAGKYLDEETVLAREYLENIIKEKENTNDK